MTAPVRNDCANPDCENTILPWSSREGLCSGCDRLLRVDTIRAMGELTHWLEREAMFITWCAEHGKPHPHDN